MKPLLRLLAAAVAALPAAALATNGMNMEGYGPVAAAMGGASQAYDNGTAALMNNPATLGMMKDAARLDVALGFLGPNVENDGGAFGGAKSTGDAYYMPAMGYARRSGAWTYGVGMFAQGGMGTDYAGNTFMSAGSGLATRSEVGVGRLLFPVVFTPSADLSVGATFDYVWAGMDLKMAMGGAQFLGMAMPGGSAAGKASGSMVSGFMGMAQQGMLNPQNPVNWGYFDFSNDNDFTGKAKGDGYGAKLGAVWKASDSLAVGASYHTKTKLSDLESDGATVSFNANVDTGMAAGAAASGSYAAMTIPVAGKIVIEDFQWPSTLALGLAFQASDAVQVVADWQRIGWKDVMKDFRMSFTANGSQSGMAQGFANASLSATLYQNWDDQDVIRLGVAYRALPELTLRAGYNHASSPIPEAYNNPLFPAIVETHYTLGAGYAFSKAASVDFALTVAPVGKATNADGIVTTHSQRNWQLMYSQRF